MNLYEMQQRFDPKTGKPIPPKWERVGWVCDYCGAKIESEYGDGPEVTYEVNELGGAEPQFDEYRIKGVDTYSLFNNHNQFVYCCDWNSGNSCEADMLADLTKGNRIQRHTMLCHVMYEARIKMLEAALKSKKYTKEQLGLEVG